jgi:PAS domain-containing protein
VERFVSKRDLLFLQGGGELGELIRTYDWSENSLGTPQTWPSSLRTALGIILHSKFPMFLFWGPHSICFYNDAYRPSLGNDGKHPYALGKPGAKVWPEIWKDINPQIQSILQGGEASWYEDQLLPIYRNGRLENAYWTYSYSPVIDETGSPAGVFVTCTETTTAVGGKKKLEESEQNLRNTILQSPVAMCILKGADNVIEIANERIIDLWGARGRNIMGQPIFAVIPELAGQGFEELLANVYTTGETYKAFGVPLTAGNNLNGLHTIYIDFLYQPYHEGDDSITGIIAVAIDATQQVVARKKLEASEARFENLIREASVGIIVLIGEEMRVSVVNSAYGRLINRTVD